MSDEPKEAGLQFERAEFAQPAAAPTCASCRSTVHGVYYDVNGSMVCERCHDDLALAHTAPGGSAARATRAIVLGLLAMVAGSVAWYGIRKLTGYEFGILAIGVGLLVGGAVRKGSGGRGGWKYQTIAMFLTYTAIVVTYVPEIVEGIKSSQSEATSVTPAGPAGPPATPPRKDEPPAGAIGIGPLALAFAFLLGLAFVAPFLMVLEDASALMGLLIIAIALYEAWKLNRRVPLQMSGPHRLGEAPLGG